MPYRQPTGQAPLAMPSGFPSGPSPTPLTPTMGAMGGAPSEPVPTTLVSPLFTPGFLRTQIGRSMRVEFLMGTNGPLIDRTGTLISVGTSYILLRPVNSDDILLCDIFSIKFVTILL